MLSPRGLLKLIFTLTACLSLAACGKPLLRGEEDQSSQSSDYEALVWESSKSGSQQWSNYIFKVIEDETPALLAGADDMNVFCPGYVRASYLQKINFWGQLMASIARYESSWEPTSRFHEATMGNDPITGQPVYSEGLLQLSYQDIQWEPRCEFDWETDKNLPVKDPQKTILNPYKNLRCGLFIMEKQIKKYGKIAIDTGVYWAVIKANGKYQKISEISKMTRSLSFCQ